MSISSNSVDNGSWKEPLKYIWDLYRHGRRLWRRTQGLEKGEASIGCRTPPACRGCQPPRFHQNCGLVTTDSLRLFLRSRAEGKKKRGKSRLPQSVKRVTVESVHPNTWMYHQRKNQSRCWNLLCRSSNRTEGVPYGTGPHCEEREDGKDVPSLIIDGDSLCLKRTLITKKFDCLFFKAL